ncbi:MAG: hypothetical protein V2A66_08535 [Pseudomonadota bacterium]
MKIIKGFALIMLLALVAACEPGSAPVSQPDNTFTPPDTTTVPVPAPTPTPTETQIASGACTQASDCDANSACSPSGKCLVKDGNPCAIKDNCLSGYCDQQKCAPIPAGTPKKENGELCSDGSACSSGTCSQDNKGQYRCSKAGKAAGEPCSDDNQCMTNWCIMKNCAYRMLYDFCDNDFECPPNNSCAIAKLGQNKGDKICLLSDEVGCVNPEQCASGKCGGGICAP